MVKKKISDDIDCCSLTHASQDHKTKKVSVEVGTNIHDYSQNTIVKSKRGTNQYVARFDDPRIDMVGKVRRK